MFTTEMIGTHPQKASADAPALAQCIVASIACEQACVACADACLSEKTVDRLRTCTKLNQDCADNCTSSGRVLSRPTPDFELVKAQVEFLALACRKCGDDCDKHAGMHEHCRGCAEACRICEQECTKFLGSQTH